MEGNRLLPQPSPIVLEASSNVSPQGPAIVSTYFISENSWQKFIQSLSRTVSVYYPEAAGEDYHLAPALQGAPPPLLFNRYRTVQPLKSLFFEFRRGVGSYFGGSGEEERGGEQVVVGMKGCDLKAMAVLDFVFAGEVPDPFYLRNRERTLIISSDCTGFKKVCFCVLVGGKPHPEEGYDLNYTPLPEGSVVEVGTPKGMALVDRFKDYFAPATQEQLEQRAEARERVAALLTEHQKGYGYLWGGVTRELMERVFESPVWEEEAERCVECGACNFVCPSCHCFFLSDHGRENFRRVRNWDACQYKGFARVGGGANPRPELYQRLRTRYEKKFCFCPAVMGVNGCTGCGRCVEACIGKIDMREVLKRLSGCK